MAQSAFQQGNLGTVSAGNSGGSDAARSTADDEEVVVVIGGEEACWGMRECAGGTESKCSRGGDDEGEEHSGGSHGDRIFLV